MTFQESSSNPFPQEMVFCWIKQEKVIKISLSSFTPNHVKMVSTENQTFYHGMEEYSILHKVQKMGKDNSPRFKIAPGNFFFFFFHLPLLVSSPFLCLIVGFCAPLIRNSTLFVQDFPMWNGFVSFCRSLLKYSCISTHYNLINFGSLLAFLLLITFYMVVLKFKTPNALSSFLNWIHMVNRCCWIKEVRWIQGHKMAASLCPFAFSTVLKNK